MSKIDIVNDSCANHWRVLFQTLGTNIGPKGATRKKIVKTGFKVIFKHLIPETLAYMSYISQFDETCSKRDMTYMKKLPRHEVLHYAQEKGFNELDIYLSL